MLSTTKQNKIKELYDKGLGVTEIHKETGWHSGNICYFLNKIYGKDRPKYKRFIYKRRVYTLIEDFFENLNSEPKGYFLGLLAADGNLSTTQNSVRISLHEKDKKILDSFIKHLNYTKPLKYLIKSKTDWNRSNQYLIEISSQTFRKSLEKYGLHPNKSLTMLFPNNIPEDFLHHYILGYFDGDGCISVNKKLNKAEISIAGSQSFCNSLCEIFNNINIKAVVAKHSSANCYYTRVKEIQSIKNLYNYMYNNKNIKSTIYLDRKKDKFDNWLVERETRIFNKKNKIKN